MCYHIIEKTRKAILTFFSWKGVKGVANGAAIDTSGGDIGGIGNVQQERECLILSVQVRLLKLYQA